MATFPVMYRTGSTLHLPEAVSYSEQAAIDPTIRNQLAAGYVKSRARFTRTPKRWTVAYEALSQANKNTLKAFEAARRVGGESFSWVNPETGVTHSVRFAAPIVYNLWQRTNFLFWNVSFELEEV